MGSWIRVADDHGFVRHYCEAPIVRTSVAPAPDDPETRANFYEVAGPALCGRKLRSYLWINKAGHKHFGGLSGVAKVNLLGGRLCAKCLRLYLKSRPHLAGAVEAARNLRIDSE